MKKSSAAIAGLVIALGASAQMPNLGDIMKGAGKMTDSKATSPVGAGDDKTNAAGIKEALAVSARRTP